MSTPRYLAVSRLSVRDWPPRRRAGLRRFVGLVLACLLMPSCDDAKRLTGPLAPNFSLNGASGFEGTITQSSGSPIQGAVITVLDPNTGATRGSGTSDANGAYAVAVANGTYDVRVEAPGFQAQVLSDLTVSGPTTLNLVLLKVVTFSGVVRSPDGEPLANQRVGLFAGGFVFMTTGADGAFSLSVSQGTYTLQLVDQSSGSAGVPRGYVINLSPFEITADREEDIVLPTVDLTVTVVDPDGNPVAQSSLTTQTASGSSCFVNDPVTILGVSARAIYCPSASTGTDNVGTLTVFAMAVPFSVFAQPPAGSQVGVGSVSFPSGISEDASITIELPPAARLTGLVQTDDGAPLARQRIRLIDGSAVIDAYTGADGRFEMFAAAATYDLLRLERDASATAPPFSYSADVRNFELTGDRDVVMTLPIHTLTVTVIDPDGNPVQGAFFGGGCIFGGSFELFPGGTVSGTNFCTSGQTNASGVMNVPFLPTSFAREATVIPPAGSDFVTTRFTVPVMDGDKAVAVTLIRSVRFTGRLLDRDGNGIAGGNLQFRSGSSVFWDQTDATGAFDIGMPPGVTTTGSLSFSTSPATRLPRSVSLELGTFSISADTELDLTLPNVILRVTVLDPAGAPVANVAISSNLLFQTGGFEVLPGQTVRFPSWQFLQGTTDQNGVALIGMLPTTAVFSITVTPPSGSSLQAVNVSVPQITADANLAVIAPPSNDAPFAVISPLDPEVDEGTSINFDGSASSDPEGSGLDFRWTMPDGTTPTTEGVTFSFPDNGSFAVELRVTDASGASDAATSTVTVSNVAPEVSINAVPAELRLGSELQITGRFDDPGVNDAPWTVTIDWGDGSPATVIADAARGADFSATHRYTAEGGVTITVGVNDKDGGAGSATATTTVVGANEPPSADAGSDQTVEWTSGGVQVTLDGSGSSDPDGDDLTFEWTDASGNVVGTAAVVTVTIDQRGDHTFRLTVRDDDLAEDSDEVTITAEDTTPPAVTLSVSPGVLWPPNHQYVLIDLSLSVSDAGDPSPSLAAGARSSEPDDANGNGDGSTTGDIRVTTATGLVRLSSNASPEVWFNPRSDAVELRAERAGGGGGRTYTITVTVTDASGNVSERTATVTAPHNR